LLSCHFFDIGVLLGWMVCSSNPARCMRFLLSPKYPYQLWGPPSLVFSGCRGSFTGAKWPGHEVNYLPPSSPQFKNGDIPLFPVCAFKE